MRRYRFSSSPRGAKLSSIARAAPLLSLESTAANLLVLQVGEDVSFQVRLSGLEAGQELTLLAATVRYSEGMLGEPSLLWAGEILPQPLEDPAYFVPSIDAGLADGTFYTFSPESAHHILSEGVFFSFTVEAVGVGSGQMWFEFADALQYNPDLLGEPISAEPALGLPLDFIVVPEPAPWLMALAAAVVVLLMLRMRPRCPYSSGSA